MRNSRMILIVLIGFLTVIIGDSRVYAHRKYQVNPNGPPRWVLQRHTHEPDGSIRYGTVPAGIESFDLLQGVGALFGGIDQIINDAITSLFVSKNEIAKSEKQDLDSGEKRTRHIRKRYTSHPPGGTTPRWIQRR